MSTPPFTDAPTERIPVVVPAQRPAPPPLPPAPGHRPRRNVLWIVLACVAALGIVGGAIAVATSGGPVESPSRPVAAPSPASTAALTPEQMYLADILDTPGLTTDMDDATIIGLGRGACDVMAYGEYSRADLVAELGASKLGPVVMGVVVDAASRHLCPWTTFPAVSTGSAASAPAVAAPPPAPAPRSPSSFTDGMYEVGTDVAPGRYRTSGDSSIGFCAWASYPDSSRDYTEVIDGASSTGQMYLTVKAGEFLETAGGCTWMTQG